MVDCIIVGGGLAGLVAAIDLSRTGREVVVMEKKQYPQHKVCGEYISNEVLPYLERLGIEVDVLREKRVDRFRLHAPTGAFVEAKLPLGGLGLRRYTLDEYLYRKAVENGVTFHFHTKVKKIDKHGEHHFDCRTQRGSTYSGKTVIGSFGKRSGLDRSLDRKFIRSKANYLGVKYYVKTEFAEDLVALYNFDGGYCGAVRVEDGSVDIAYLTRHSNIKKQGGIREFEQRVLYRNPALRALLKDAERLTEPMTISNVSFRSKELIKDGILMIGDAAGMIPPLCGNGMAMGIHAAQMAASLINDYLDGQISRSTLENDYLNRWNKQFGRRLFWGRQLHQFMGQPLISTFAVNTLRLVPGLLPPIIRQTHGRVIT